VTRNIGDPNAADVVMTLNDQWLGERQVELVSIAVVRDQHRLLCAMRDDGRVPSQELLDDIAAYASIINARDPEHRADEYFEAVDVTPRPRPRQVARAKGWMP